MSKNGKNNDLFGDLYSQTQANVDQMAKGPVDVVSQLDALEKEAVEISQISDDKERSKRNEILQSKLNTLRDAVKSDEMDMAKAMYGMEVLIQGMDKEFQNLVAYSDSEQSVIDAANSLVTDTGILIENAKKKVEAEEADNGFLGFGFGKEGRVNQAKQALKGLEDKFVKFEEQIPLARQKAEEMKRERLISASIEDTLNMIQVMGEKTVQIMTERTKTIDEHLKAIQARKAKAFEIKNDAAKRAGALLTEVEDLSQELQNEELAVDSYEVGSTEHTNQVQKVSDMRSQLEEKKGQLKIAQAVLDEKTKSIQEHEAHETGQQKLLSNHRMWIAKLKSKLQEDIVKDASYLEMLKAAADQEIAQNVDGMSDEKNARQMENVAKIIVASDKAYMDSMKLTPEQIRRRANVANALAEHAANLSDDEQKLRDEMIKNYGIDPLDASEFTHRGNSKSVNIESTDVAPKTTSVGGGSDELFN